MIQKKIGLVKCLNCHLCGSNPYAKVESLSLQTIIPSNWKHTNMQMQAKPLLIVRTFFGCFCGDVKINNHGHSSCAYFLSKGNMRDIVQQAWFAWKHQALHHLK